MPRIFATNNIGPEALDHLRKRGYEVEVYDLVEPPPKSLIVEKVRSGIDGLITTLSSAIDEEVISAGAGTLRVIAQANVGFNNIDRVAANRYKIPFTNTPGVLTDTTAEFAFFMMGSVARRMYPSERLIEENTWPVWHSYEPFLGDEVSGKTVAVIGTGRIGKSFVNKCVGFDMDILCYHHEPDRESEREFATNVQKVMDIRFQTRLCKRQQKIEYVDFETALQKADFVSLHVPLLMPDQSPNPTYHMMAAEQFRTMKATAYLINSSRGQIVDERALYDALISNEIAGAALDVFEEEPLPPDSPLRDPRLHLRLRKFHHFASGARATRLSTDPGIGMAGRCIQGLIDVIEENYGGDIQRMPFVVNKEAFK
jgi:glyoxylate reductase